METNTILLGVLLVVASALCGVAIWALFEGVKTARSARQLSDDVDARLVPLLEKADVTVDALNAELLRIDSIVTRIDEITDRVESTTRTVQEVANAPGEIVTDIADRVRRAWKRRQTESAATSEARHAEAEQDASAEAAPDEPGTDYTPAEQGDDDASELALGDTSPVADDVPNV